MIFPRRSQKRLGTTRLQITWDTPHLILSQYSTSSAQKQTSAPGCYKARGSVGTRVSADLSPGNIYCIKQTTDDDLSMKHSLKSSIPSRKIRQRHTCNQFLFSTPTRRPSAGISSGRNLVEYVFFSVAIFDEPITNTDNTPATGSDRPNHQMQVSCLP